MNSLEYTAKLKHFIEEYEGRRTKVYYDSVRDPQHPHGIATIGVGCNLERKSAQVYIKAMGVDFDKLLAGEIELTEPQIEALLTCDLATAISGAKTSIKNFHEHAEPVQFVIIDMVFNLGVTGFRKFKKTIAALEKRDYNKAANEMIDSDWYRQVGHRSKRNVGIVLRQIKK